MRVVALTAVVLTGATVLAVGHAGVRVPPEWSRSVGRIGIISAWATVPPSYLAWIVNRARPSRRSAGLMRVVRSACCLPVALLFTATSLAYLAGAHDAEARFIGDAILPLLAAGMGPPRTEKPREAEGASES